MMKILCKLSVAILMMGILTGCKRNESKTDQVIIERIKDVQESSEESVDVSKQENKDLDETEENNSQQNPIQKESETETEVNLKNGDIDIDLTQLSSTFVYSEVYDMMVKPENYIGKTIRMTGTFNVYVDEKTNKTYYACFISDATACCQQGIEFELKGKHKYPDDYPKQDDEITVTGEFEMYKEEGEDYCRLKNAKMECD